MTDYNRPYAPLLFLAAAEGYCGRTSHAVCRLACGGVQDCSTCRLSSDQGDHRLRQVVTLKMSALAATPMSGSRHR